MMTRRRLTKLSINVQLVDVTQLKSCLDLVGTHNKDFCMFTLIHIVQVSEKQVIGPSTFSFQIAATLSVTLVVQSVLGDLIVGVTVVFVVVFVAEKHAE